MSRNNAYYPLIPGGRYDGPEPDNYTGDPYDCDPPRRNPQIWHTQDGRTIPLVQLEEKHLLNILRACRAGSIQVPEDVLNAVAQEVQRRGLTPLPDYESRDEALSVSAVSSLYVFWPRLPTPDRPGVLDVFLRVLTAPTVDVDDEILSGLTAAQQQCVAALMGHFQHRQRCSPAAQERCAEVLARWASVQGLSLSQLLNLTPRGGA